jgi:hypothetical protein
MTLLTPELLDTKTYDFEKLRYLLQSMAVQEGVVDPNDLKVVQRAAGANMSVDVGAGRCFVQADTGTRNGLYHAVNDATVNVAVGASHATLPRVDQIVIEVRDTSDLGSSADDAIFRVIAGTPTSGATLDNAYTTGGAAALPNNCIRLADVLVPAASSSVVTANIRDRRRWARGAYVFALITPGDITLTGSFQAVGSKRIELSPNRQIKLAIQARFTTSGGSNMSIRPQIDNADAFAGDLGFYGSSDVMSLFYVTGAQASGSHVLQWGVRSTAGGVTTLHANSGLPTIVEYRETQISVENT